MYINIQSRLFTNDPVKRFEVYRKCDTDVWRKLWYHYKFLEYTEDEAHEYLVTILKVPISRKKFMRWIRLTEIYLKAQQALKDDIKQVDSKYFGKYKDFVEITVTKNNKKQ